VLLLCSGGGCCCCASEGVAVVGGDGVEAIARTHMQNYTQLHSQEHARATRTRAYTDMHAHLFFFAIPFSSLYNSLY